MAETIPPKKDHSNPDSDAFEAEFRQLDPSQFPLLTKYAEAELYRMRGGVTDLIDLIANEKAKVRVKVNLPNESETGINYVGKLLGPRGSIFRSIQENTHTRMAILGQGSMRNEQKEQELLESGEQKYQHLKQKLHMQIDCYSAPVDAYYNIWCALCECRKILNEPDMGPPGQQGMVPQMQGGFQNSQRGGRGSMMRGGFNRGATVASSMNPQTVPPQISLNGQQSQIPVQTDLYGNPIASVPPVNFGADYTQAQNWGGKMNQSTGEHRGGRGGGRGGRGRAGAHPYARRGGAKPQ